MQKTILFGKKVPLPQNIDPKATSNQCHHRLKLELQVSQLKQLLHLQQLQQSSTCNTSQSSDNSQGIERELCQLRARYVGLRKKVEIIEKENDKLFEENESISKEINNYRRRLEKYEQEQNQPLLIDSYCQLDDVPKCCQQAREKTEELEKRNKELQAELFVWRQKTTTVEQLMEGQGDELARLKELIKRKNRLQEGRHQMLQMVCF